MRWRLICEEYGPILKYVKGDKNVVADALSRLKLKPKPKSSANPSVLEEPDIRDLAEVFMIEEEEEFPHGQSQFHINCYSESNRKTLN